MKETPFPCGDLLVEGRLDVTEIYERVGFLMRSLRIAARYSDEAHCEHDARAHAKEAKEEICAIINELMKVRDKITFWQAWASDDSPIN